ncbi:hypothetical protein L1987_53436 [Smallanthus sonchifolius]|uniref:Uncharacterized protein n=1 Tax=Smallanthus sonchifolius TaxID=185202 RepID=A0ACB9EW95_9ASTR|nr:hypothetical protein L1987_53436 [Smallanthus sonchifolius]
MLTSFIPPSTDEEHIIGIASSFPVATLGNHQNIIHSRRGLRDGAFGGVSYITITCWDCQRRVPSAPTSNNTPSEGRPLITLLQNPLTRRCHHFPKPWARVFGQYSVENRLTTNLRTHCSMHTQTLS